MTQQPTAIDPAVYTADYYKSSNYADYLERVDRYKKTAYELAGFFRQIKLVERQSTIVDYGCAVGFLLEGFRDIGYENLVGVEVSTWARNEAAKRGNRVVSSASELANHPVDLLISLDVFEHMTDDEVIDALAKIKPKALLVRIPSSTDGGKTFHLDVSRSDPTHINCKTKEQWIEFFARNGFKTALKLNLYTVYDTPGVSCFLLL